MACVALSLLALTTGAATAGEDIVRDGCAQCHRIEGQAPNTLAELQARKGPDLAYAGVKFRREWLVQWLQDPVRIRPAGTYFANHVEHDGERDVIVTEDLPEHPVLDADAAGRAADWLMTLREGADRVTAGEYRPGTIALSMGEMLFDRFRGCLACHEIEPGYGGLSGPEVHTAAARLQPDWMISYIRNPQAWDPLGIMPARKLSDNDLQRLVHYLRALNGEAEQ